MMAQKDLKPIKKKSGQEVWKSRTKLIQNA